jgi:hypothetical protein
MKEGIREELEDTHVNLRQARSGLVSRGMAGVNRTIVLSRKQRK